MRAADRKAASTLGAYNNPDAWSGISFFHSFVKHSFKNVNPCAHHGPIPVLGAGDGKLGADGHVPSLATLAGPWGVHTSSPVRRRLVTKCARG